ncbi:MAG: hypothetical protein IT340_02515 [Chloroflexi bacterium]|nr:hypothetical protein [Chloroflexota bacterium]
MPRRAPLYLLLAVLLSATALAGLPPAPPAQAAAPPSPLALLRGQFASLEASLRAQADTSAVTRQLAGRDVAGLAVTGGDPIPPAGLKPEEQQAWRAALTRDGASGPAQLAPFFPNRFGEPFAVSGGGATVVFQARGANVAAVALDEGKVVYQDAYRDTDSIHAVGKDRSEEFLLLRSAAAPARFSYDILSIDGVTDVTLRERGVHFTGPGGGLQIEAPWLVDAAGQRHDKPVHWELDTFSDGAHRLTLVLEPAGLTYPLVIDPTWLIGVGLAHPGNIGIARLEHTTTLLNNGTSPLNGHILVAGGLDALGNATVSAELFNAITNIWSYTGSLAVARKNHTATLLPNGKVLVAGGFNGRESQLAGAEIYDPETKTWTQTCSLNVRRERHTATLLHSGKVLVTGGQTNTGASVASAELYDPAAACPSPSMTWTMTGSMTDAREKHTTTLLPDGRVLVIGGLKGTSALSDELTTAEIYNPATGSWSPAGTLSQKRQRHTATLLRDGKVLVVGGCWGFNATEPPCLTPVAVTEVYDPATGNWTTSDQLRRFWDSDPCPGGFDHTATLLPDGRVMIVGGRTTHDCGSAATVKWRSIDSYAIYNSTAPSLSRWVQSGMPVAQGVPVTAHARYGHTATLLPNGIIFITSGYNQGVLTLPTPNPFDPWEGALSGMSTQTLWYNPSEGAFSPVTPIASTVARADHTATYLPTIKKVLVTGGTGASGPPLRSAALYDSETGAWTPVGDMSTARSGHTATLLFTGQVLVAGGLGDAATTTSTEIFEPTTLQWRPVGSLNTQRYSHTATLLANGQVLVVGGNISAIGYTDTAELFDPATEAWVTTNSVPKPPGPLDGRARHTATLLPDGTVLVAGGYNGPVGGIATAHRFNPVTRTWAAANSSLARYWHTATLLPNGLVFIFGGDNGTGKSPVGQTYNPSTNTWKNTKWDLSDFPADFRKYGHTATMLGSGWVLLAGGFAKSTASNDAYLYITEADDYVYVGSLMGTGRYAHTASLLPNQKVLLTGGFTAPLRGGPTESAELYDRGLGFQDPAWRPNVTSLTSGTFTNQLRIGSSIVANGTGFASYGLPPGSNAGKPEGSGGSGAANSATNYPVLQLQSLANEEQRLIPLDQTVGWSATSFTSAAIEAFTPGWAFATIIVNGIPSKSFAFEILSPLAGATTWYFAEGYTGAGFDEYLTIQNPNASAADVKITYYLGQGGPEVRTFSVPANRRDTVVVHEAARGVGRNQAVSAKVESTNGVGIIVERPMYFNYTGAGVANVDGAHNVMGVTATQKTWLFAEGWTGAGFDEYLTIMNPNPNAITITITYYLSSGQVITKNIPVLASSRYTVSVHSDSEGVGRDKAVSARVTTSDNGGIVVERPMYFRYSGATMSGVDGGHNVMGAPQPRTNWYFPEGFTGNATVLFDTYLTIMNMDANPAPVTLTYFIAPNAAPTVKNVTVPANSRYTVNVHDAAEGVGRDRGVATHVMTSNPNGIVVERPTYFRTVSAPLRDGGFNVMGAPQPKKAWFFAEGYTGDGFDQSLIILNPHTSDAAVTITYFLDSGTPVIKQLTVPDRERRIVLVHEMADGVGRGKAVSAKVETTHSGGIVVERPMYFTFTGSMGTVTDAHTVMGYAP